MGENHGKTHENPCNIPPPLDNDHVPNGKPKNGLSQVATGWSRASGVGEAAEGGVPKQSKSGGAVWHGVLGSTSDITHVGMGQYL